MYNIKTSWVYENILYIIIAGLVTGIAIEWVVLAGGIKLPEVHAEALVYEKKAEMVCDLDCEIVERTQRIFEEQKDYYMEQARLEALVEMRDVLIGKMDNSPYVDYQAMQEKYGY